MKKELILKLHERFAQNGERRLKVEQKKLPRAASKLGKGDT